MTSGVHITGIILLIKYYNIDIIISRSANVVTLGETVHFSLSFNFDVQLRTPHTERVCRYARIFRS